MTIAREEIFGPVLSTHHLQDRRRGDRDRQRRRSTAWPRRCGRATSPPRTAWRARCAPAPCTSTATTRTTSRCRSAASSSPGIGRDKSLHALEKYTELKTTWIDLVLTPAPLSRARERGPLQVPRQCAARVRRPAGARAERLRRERRARARRLASPSPARWRVAYRACLWSRIANRVFLEVAQFEARDADEFLRGRCARIDWTAHLGAGGDARLRFQRPPSGHHPHALRRAEAQGRDRRLRCATARGARPDVAPERPDVRVHAHAQRYAASRCRSICPAKACTAAAIAARAARRR